MPAGYYDRQQGVWVAAPNGRVVGVVALVDGRALLDMDGDGDADAADVADLPISDEERAALATRAQVGQSFWRVPVDHFTPWDFNWPFGPPSDAVSPPDEGPSSDPSEDDPCEKAGSVIECESQTLGEALDLTGTPFQMHYRSDRVPGRTAANTIDIPLSTDAPLPSSLQRMQVTVTVAGQQYTQHLDPAGATSVQFVWDGLGAYGRPSVQATTAAVAVTYEYPLVHYAASTEYAAAFGRIGTRTRIGGGRTTDHVRLERHWQVPLQSVNLTTGQTVPVAMTGWQTAPRRPAPAPRAPAVNTEPLGGWTIAPVHRYDPAGHMLYLGDGSRQSVAGWASRMFTVAAGGGTGTSSPATSAFLASPQNVVGLPMGGFYVADTDNHRIVMVAPDGAMTTVAGSGEACPEPTAPCGDGGDARAAQLNYPMDLTVDRLGNLYIADSNNYRVRRVDAQTGQITTIAGNGSNGGEYVFAHEHGWYVPDPIDGDGGPAVAASLSRMEGIVVSPADVLYIADTDSSRIRAIDLTTGIITTTAGIDQAGCDGDGYGCRAEGDGVPASTAYLGRPSDLALDAAGQLYIADRGGNSIRRVDVQTGIITTVAGTGTDHWWDAPVQNGLLATLTDLRAPQGIAVGADGTLYIADTYAQRIRRVDPVTQILTTIAGTGDWGFYGDGQPGPAAALAVPGGLWVGADGEVLIADTWNHRIRQLAPGGAITTVAGRGASGSNASSGDGVLAPAARLDAPADVLVVAGQGIYIADTDQHRIRLVTEQGTITTIAGTGEAGLNTAERAMQARLNHPRGLARDAAGNLYVADTGNQVVRQIAPDGRITTIAGGGTTTDLTAAPRATDVALGEPVDVAVAPDGTIYIAEAGAHRVSAVGTDGRITVIMGTGVAGTCDCDALRGEQVARTRPLHRPESLAVDDQGGLYIANTGANELLFVRYGMVTQVAGGGTDDGDVAAPSRSRLAAPTGLALHGSQVFFVERDAHRIRRLIVGDEVTTMLGIVTADGLALPTTQLASPQGLSVDGAGNLVIADTGNDRVLRERSPLPGYQRGGYVIPSRDGRDVYHFTAQGRHLRTSDALTNATRYRFWYDTQGRLVGVTDGNNLHTRLSYAPAAAWVDIIGPYGHRTRLTLGADGYVAAVENPAQAQTRLTYDRGLLTSMTSPRGAVTRFTYDAEGRLTRDTNPVGSFTELARTARGGDTPILTVRTTNALSHTETLTVTQGGPATPEVRTSVDAQGGVTIQQEVMVARGRTAVRESVHIDPRGVRTTVVQGPDPRWGMGAPWTTETTSVTADGTPIVTMVAQRAVILGTPGNPLTLQQQTDTVTVNGRTVTTEYLAATRTMTITQPGGVQTVTTLDSAGRIVREVTTDRAPVVTTYDEVGRVVRRVEGRGADARVTQFGYGPDGALERVIDPLGQVTRYAYDVLGRVVAQVLPTGQVLRTAYDAHGNVTRATHPQGTVVAYEYDLANRRTAAILDPDGAAIRTTYQYDRANNLHTIIADAGVGRANETSTFTSVPVGAGPRYAVRTATNPLGETTIYTYTQQGDLTQIQDPLGQTTVITYTPEGWAETLQTPEGHRTHTTYTRDGKPWVVTDARGSTTAYTYDGAGRLATITAGTSAVGDAPAVNQTTTFTYDAQGQIATVTDGRGAVTTYETDAFGRLVAVIDPLGNQTTTVYDAGDQVRSTIVGANVATEALTTTYTYDALGRVLTEHVDPDGANLTATYSYTATGSTDTWNLQAVRDPNGQVTRYAYDLQGLLTATTDAAGQTWQYEYDRLGRLREETDPRQVTTVYGVDALGRTTSLTRAGQTERWRYRADGLLGGMTDFAGRETVYQYDGDQRLRLIDYADGTPDVQFAYDPAGNLVTMTDGLGVTSYTYDVLNRMATRTRTGQTLTYGYTAASDLETIDYWGTGTVTYGYDVAGRVARLTPWGSTPTTYGYRSTGLLADQPRGNGVQTAYGYDTASRLNGVRHRQGGATLLDLAYAHDPNGNTTDVQETTANEAQSLVTTLQYDVLNRLRAVAYPAVPEGPGAETVTYGYDPVGNRTTVNAAARWAYDAHDRITTAGYTYDANGNLTSDGTTTYAYDAANRLVRSTTQGLVTAYGYDGHGNLVERSVNGVVTRYVVDESGPLPLTVGELRADGGVTRYAYGPDGVAAQQPGGQAVQYPLLDGQGSLRGLTDAGGHVVAARRYDVFGQVRGTSGAWPSALGYMGAQDDAGDGTVYLRARHYRPDLGRFLQRDTFAGYATMPQTQNRYVYAGNNPAMHRDPGGRDFLSDVGALATELNRRVGPEALRASYDWARDVRGRVQADPSLLWAAVTHPCVLDAVQQALDVLGMVPGLGEPFDVANAMLSAGRGRYVEAAISLAAAVPGIGQGVTGAKLAARHADELAGAAGGLGRYTDAATGAVRSCVRANSFDGDTAVATPDGERPIRDIAVGDTVLAYDQATGTTGTYTVTDVIVHYDLMQVDVTIAGETLDTTPEHPFFVLLRG